LKNLYFENGQHSRDVDGRLFGTATATSGNTALIE